MEQSIRHLGFMEDINSIKETLYKARIYRGLAWIFGIAGFIAFIVIYDRYMDGGNVFEAMQKPRYLIMTILMFTPGWIFFLSSLRSQKRADQMAKNFHHKKK